MNTPSNWVRGTGRKWAQASAVAAVNCLDDRIRTLAFRQRMMKQSISEGQDPMEHVSAFADALADINLLLENAEQSISGFCQLHVGKASL